MKNKDKITVDELLGSPEGYEQILPVPHGFRLIKIKKNIAYYIKGDTPINNKAHNHKMQPTQTTGGLWTPET